MNESRAKPELAQDTTLVTGFPSYTARRMIDRLLGAGQRVFMLVRHQDSLHISEYLSTLEEEVQRRLLSMIGDPTSMDLGLSGKEYRLLVNEVTCIHHLAGRYHLGATPEEVEQLNVGGTRGVLELALECRALRRFCFWSTVHVSGDREGVVMEGELDCGQTFRNAYEESKYKAEQVVRSMSRRVPSTILRPGIIIGDSTSGVIERYDGPYHLMRVLMNSPFDLQLPLPGRGDGPLHVVPIDYVIEAGYTLAQLEETVSKTFHLVDPAPLSGRAIYELVADRAHRKVPRAVIPSAVARVLLKLPLPWVGDLRGSPKTIMEGFNQLVYYNARNTLEALRGSNVWCPPFERYVDNVVRFLKDTSARRGDDEVPDPLD
ncbi:MAG: epimerase [Proteobacteria bacterium]|nr:MAG: epimerase [Pseudomonadota bacterium]PIE18925.1 MAG: epimerase [Pseudomonadota bacterium]